MRTSIMPKHHQILRTRLMLIVLGSMALSLMLPQAEAHIVPPERLHPVTESYQRMGFLLNLNPVRWPEVARDATTIADGLAAVESVRAAAYRREAQSLLNSAIEASGGDGPLPSEQREATARRVFRLSANAVHEKLRAHLTRAGGRLDERGYAALELDEARQLWTAFEPELRFADRQGFVEHGRRWLELSSALGSPGVLGLGAIAADRKTFEREAKQILGYLAGALQVSSEATLPASDRPFTDERGSLRIRLGALPDRPTFAAQPTRLPPGSEINKQLPRPRQVLNMAARGVDESETPLIALGDMAFDSAEIFGEPARSLGISCNTCHNKSITNPKFFIPGLSARPGGLDVSSNFFAPHANNGLFDHVDIPDLRGIRFTGPYGRNGRFASLAEFTRNVIVNEFNGPEPDPVLVDGLVAYMLEFDFLPNPHLEADGTLAASAPPAARRGEEIFRRPFEQMDGRSCASCHVPADHFLDHKRYDVGTVAGAEKNSRDRAMETPTLLSAAFTAPYFHDGSAPTLRAVSEHFNEHYGLGLSDHQLADLTAYVETVGDGTEAYEDTLYTLDAELEEFSFFLSAYEFLRSRGKTEVIGTTLETVAFEIRAHKWDVQDRRYLPVLDRMEELVRQAYQANEQGDAPGVGRLLGEYRDLYEENKAVLR